MTFFDAVLLLVVAAFAVGGWQRGFFVGFGGLAGFVVGFWLGRESTPLILDWVTAQTELTDTAKLIWSIALPLGLGFIVSSAGGYLGWLVRRRLLAGGRTFFDSFAGALTSIVACGLVIWLAAGFVRTTSSITGNSLVAQSQVVAGLDRLIPVPSGRAVGTVAQAFSEFGFPQVFSGQAEDIRAVGEPSDDMVAVGRDAEESVVRVVSSTPQCGQGTAGTGWVLDDGLVVTNAHVVAGSDGIAVQAGGIGEPYDAEVVAFDPDTDVAVLRAPRLGAPALRTGNELGVGDDSVIVGFPGNGPFTISPSRVRDTVNARGLNIYNDDTVTREVYSLRAVVREGNSGGPLLDANGHAVGLVFARSASDADTGYALTLDEIAPILEQARAEADPVPTGRCAA